MVRTAALTTSGFFEGVALKIERKRREWNKLASIWMNANRIEMDK